MTDPSEALPFSEAAREAAARALYPSLGVDSPAFRHTQARAKATGALAAAVGADPWLKAFLRLAALSDEERERIVADALVRMDAYDPALLSAEEISMFRVSRFGDARRILAALGLPAEQEGTG